MNQRGFGLLAMCGFCTFLGLCLLTSVYYCHKLIEPTYYHSIDHHVNSNSNMHRMYNDYSDVNGI